MTQRILIDAVHPEEKRIAITQNDRLQEFDVETSIKTQNKGNIYLGKITRVEPSLQAVFVEYGGNRQGFLPFSEVHYDYYQIPVSDKEALLSDLDKENEEIVEADESEPKEGKKKTDATSEAKGAEEGAVAAEEESDSAESPESIEDETEEARRSVGYKFYRRYKIQEVLRRNQIVLVQVIKDERGSKGAALSTYLSLPGRYCVFMPNNPRGGGVSRRITDKKDRAKMKGIVEKLGLEKGSSIIMRTAGLDRRLPEIRRDYGYLSDQWNAIRGAVLEANAPERVYQEGDIITRTLRDLFRGNIEEVVIEGSESYKAAQKYVKALSPKDAKLLKEHNEKRHIFRHYGIDEALDSLHDNEVTLPSGGSIVLHQTEALVAIDVNSGKATRSRNIEETALSTNVEAAQEVARQLRLRDLAGLVVIDFIDMREYRNRRQVERSLKDALKKDRARIQVGRISSFGLMEMSRQRMHSSIVETATVACGHCAGTGYIRSPESNALRLLRIIEAEAKREGVKEVKLHVSLEMASLLLNQRRNDVSALEEAHEVRITILHDIAIGGNDYKLAGNRRRQSRGRGERNSHGKEKKSEAADSNANANNASTDDATSKENAQAESKPHPRKHSSEKTNKPGKAEETGNRGRGGRNRSAKPKQPKEGIIPADEQQLDNDIPQKQELDDESAAPKKRRGRHPRKAAQTAAPATEASSNEDSKKLKGLWKKITQ